MGPPRSNLRHLLSTGPRHRQISFRDSATLVTALTRWLCDCGQPVEAVAELLELERCRLLDLPIPFIVVVRPASSDAQSAA